MLLDSVLKERTVFAASKAAVLILFSCLTTESTFLILGSWFNSLTSVDKEVAAELSSFTSLRAEARFFMSRCNCEIDCRSMVSCNLVASCNPLFRIDSACAIAASSEDTTFSHCKPTRSTSSAIITTPFRSWRNGQNFSVEGSSRGQRNNSIRAKQFLSNKRTGIRRSYIQCLT